MVHVIEENPIAEGYGTVHPDFVSDSENKLNVTFPREFRSWVIGPGKDMGAPSRDCFLVAWPRERRFYGSCIGAVLSFDPKYRFNIILKNQDPPEAFPRGLIAFAEDGGGDYICFDYRSDPKTDDPPVIYWAHEFTDVDDGLVPLAPNFEAFLGMLMSEEEAEAALEKLNKEG